MTYPVGGTSLTRLTSDAEEVWVLDSGRVAILIPQKVRTIKVLDGYDGDDVPEYREQTICSPELLLMAATRDTRMEMFALDRRDQDKIKIAPLMIGHVQHGGTVCWGGNNVRERNDLRGTYAAFWQSGFTSDCTATDRSNLGRLSGKVPEALSKLLRQLDNKVRTTYVNPRATSALSRVAMQEMSIAVRDAFSILLREKHMSRKFHENASDREALKQLIKDAIKLLAKTVPPAIAPLLKNNSTQFKAIVRESMWLMLHRKVSGCVEKYVHGSRDKVNDLFKKEDYYTGRYLEFHTWDNCGHNLQNEKIEKIDVCDVVFQVGVGKISQWLIDNFDIAWPETMAITGCGWEAPNDEILIKLKKVDGTDVLFKLSKEILFPLGGEKGIDISDGEETDIIDGKPIIKQKKIATPTAAAPSLIATMPAIFLDTSTTATTTEASEGFTANDTTIDDTNTAYIIDMDRQTGETLEDR